MFSKTKTNGDARRFPSKGNWILTKTLETNVTQRFWYRWALINSIGIIPIREKSQSCNRGFNGVKRF